MAIPILSRLSLWDYQRIIATFLFLFMESIVRFIIYFSPVYLIDCLHSKIFKHIPRIFKISKDEERSHPMSTYSDTAKMIEYHGYGVEEHTVLTKDGYFLVLHRIINERLQMNTKGSKHTSKKPAILLMHGCMMSSEVWVCNLNAKKCYAFVLSDLGFDIWLGNFRGNKYSHKHTTLKPSDKAFWDFSLDELAYYDIPCMIEYVLFTTELSSLSYLGFSQGSTVCFSALSIHKALNSKINLFIALATTVSPKGLERSLVSSLIKASPELIYLIFGRHMFLSIVLFWQDLLLPSAFSFIIDASIHFLFGWTANNLTKEDKQTLYPHLYSFTSVKLIVHWFQIIREKKLQMYDDGVSLFGKGHIPPRYRLRDIRTPIHAFYGESDTLIDINRAIKELPLKVETIKIEEYEHLDFLFANNVDSRVMPLIIPLLMDRLDKANHNSDLIWNVALSSSSSSSSSSSLSSMEKYEKFNIKSMKNDIVKGLYCNGNGYIAPLNGFVQS